MRCFHWRVMTCNTFSLDNDDARFGSRWCVAISDVLVGCVDDVCGFSFRVYLGWGTLNEGVCVWGRKGLARAKHHRQKSNEHCRLVRDVHCFLLFWCQNVSAFIYLWRTHENYDVGLFLLYPSLLFLQLHSNILCSTLFKTLWFTLDTHGIFRYVCVKSHWLGQSILYHIVKHNYVEDSRCVFNESLNQSDPKKKNTSNAFWTKYFRLLRIL